MKHLHIGLIGALAFGVATTALAQAGSDTSSSTMQQPFGVGASGTQMANQKVTAGPKDDALAPLFSTGGTWTGQVAAGAMGPSSPATTSQGQARCQRVLDGLWYRCEIQDRMGEGAQASNFRGEMIVGYDHATQQYTGFFVDNQGSQATPMNGELTGKKFSLETPTEIASMGQRFKDRLTFDFSDPNNIRFTDEHRLPGKDWQMFESAVIHPRSSRQARTPAPLGR